MDHATNPERPALRRVWRSGSLSFIVLFVVTVGGLWTASLIPVSGAAGCGLTNPAFCDTFDQGPAPFRGRGGDLSAAKWSAARLAPSDFSGPVANPVRSAPIPPCKASFSQTTAFPPDDTLICDPSGNRSAQLMTAVAAQNYGNNSYMIRQPFDFAGRTGKIVFDVDAATPGGLAGWIALDITQDPVPAPTFREWENYEPGPVPRNGVMLKWTEVCGSNNTKVTVGNILVYHDYAATVINASGASCVNTLKGSLNHFEVTISQSQIEVWGSDYSTDNGNTFPNFRKLYTTSASVPFARGYVHVSARNHATGKYGYGEDMVYHWDNIGFDGPVIVNPRAYEIPNNTTNTTHDNVAMKNLGYQLQDGTVGGKPAGMYDPSIQIAPFQIAAVDMSGVMTAQLTMNAFFNAIGHSASPSWGLSYQFNGGTARTRMLTTLEAQALNTAGSAGNLAMVLDVPLADLRNGTNTLELRPIGAPMDSPPAIANIDLVLGLSAPGPVPTPPANLRILQ
jgi:hypothetical protein